MNQAPRGAVDKAFDLLKAFGDDGSMGLGVTELARRTNMSKSTAFRLLATLVSNGAVEKAGDQYRLGALFFDVAKNVDTPDFGHVGEVLTPFLSALFERTRHTVHLGTVVGAEVVYVNKLLSARSIKTPSRIGGRVPAFCTGVGKAIMAFDEQIYNAAVAAGLPQWTSRTITDPEQLRRTLEQVRLEGVAYDREEIAIGLTCVAAPVFGWDRRPVAAISVSGPVGEIDLASQKTMLLKVAQAASRAYVRATPKH